MGIETGCVFLSKMKSRINGFKKDIHNIFTKRFREKVLEFMTVTPNQLIATRPREAGS